MSAADPPPRGGVRVVRVIARLNVGGPSWHVVLLTAGTRSKYPTLLAVGAVGPGERDMSAFATARGVEVLTVPGLGREPGLLGDLRAFWTLWRLFRRVRPEIVHTHTAKAGALGRVAALLAGVPVRVHTFHGHVFHGYFGRLRTTLFLAIERLLARFTTCVVAISPRQADELSRYLGLARSRIAIVPLGLDLARFVDADGQAARRRFRECVAAGDAVVVTMVGRLTAIKNHALALRALATASIRAPTLKMVLVGGGEEELALRALAEQLGVGDRVQFAGWWDDLEAVYYGSEVIALTSINEGTPVCLIEALACNCAVIATDVGGVADVLDNGSLGVMVGSEDVAALADAFVRLSDPAVRAQYTVRGRDRVLKRYDSQRLVKDIEELYDHLLERGRGGPS